MPAVWHPISADNGSVSVDSVLIFASRGAPSVSVVDGLKKQLAEHGKANPRGAGYVHLIDVVPGRGSSDAEAREAFVDLIKHVTPAVRAALVVINGAGFAAATARITASAVLLAARGEQLVKSHDATQQAIKIHKSIAEGMPWFEGALRKAGANVPPAGVVLDAGNELLRRIEARGK